MNYKLLENPALGPTVRRHHSKQDYETPAEFIQAVEVRFGKIKVDLAATEQNAKADRYITQASVLSRRPAPTMNHQTAKCHALFVLARESSS